MAELPLLGHPMKIHSATRLDRGSRYEYKTMGVKKKRSLNEVDGQQAWLTLACIFIINANTLGSLKVYGLIFEEIVSQKYYNREEASWPISTASTIQNLAGLLTPLLALKISWRSIEIIQTFLFVGANVGAYFSQNLTLDIFCLGIVQGVALSLRYNMNVVINNEYFSKYRATAMGVSLAGSTCGVFALKPIISYVLDSSDHKFRYAYLTLGIIMSFNILLNIFIRRPKISIDLEREMDSHDDPLESSLHSERISISTSMTNLMKNPSIHCIWIMQTVYFYISRTYTIFVVDYGIDKGFTKDDSRSILNFWVYGEIGGRLLLGGFVDSRLMTLRWNIFIVNIFLALSGFALLVDPSVINVVTNAFNTTATNTYYYWYFGICVSLVAALSSLVNMLIVPFGQEYLGKKNVPWAFAMGSVVTSLFLLLRPSLIGLSRDHYKSYDLLIIVMSSSPCVYALIFILVEPFLKRFSLSQRNNYDLTI